MAHRCEARRGKVVWNALTAWRDRLAEHSIVVQTVDSDDGAEHILKVRSASGEPANLSDDQVEKRKGKVFLKGTDLELVGKAEKMSKSRGNVVNPDHVVREYGADSLPDSHRETFLPNGPLPTDD